MTDRSRFIEATRIGEHAYRYLTTRPRSGRVVSSFSGGINLLFENGKAFIPVQAASVPLHPWAIEILGEPLHLPEGTPTRSEKGEISIGNVHIVLSTVQVEDLSLPRFSAHEAAIALRNLPILTSFVEEARKTHSPDPFQPEIDAILGRWHKSNDPTVLHNLIGLGAGATPSGDDVLVGILAGMSVFEGVDQKFEEVLSHLRTRMRDSVRERTPLPSAQMLLAACEGSFGEPIIELATALISPTTSEDSLLERVRSVFRLGHHSGHCILLGLHISDT